MFTHSSLKRTLTIGLALGAAACPAAASARAIVPGDPGAQGITAPPAHVHASSGRHQVSGTAPSDDFRWDDAGIGAAATIALLGAGGVATIGLRRRQTHRHALS